MHRLLSSSVKVGLLVYLGLMLFVTVKGQSTTDSLLKVIKVTNNPSDQVDLYFELGYQLRNINIKEAESAFLKALELADSTGYVKGLAKAQFGYGIVLGRRNELDSALYYYRLARETFEPLKLLDEVGRVLNSIGLAEYRKGNLLEAQENLQQVLMDRSGITDSQLLIMVHNNLAMVLKKRGDLVGALQYYQAALRLCEKQNDVLGRSKVLNNVGLLYETLNQPELAIDYFNQSLQINRQQGWRKREAWPLHNIGLVYEGIKEYDKSLNYYYQSLKIKEELDDQRGISISLNNIGIVYKNKGEYELAHQCFQKSLDIKQKIGMKAGIAHTLTNMGSLHQLQEHYKEAIKAFKKAEKISVSILSLKEQLRVCQGLYECYKLAGKTSLALTYLEQYSDLNEQLFNEENSRQIANLEIEYQTEQKEKENDLLRQQIDLNQSKIKYQLIIGLILCAALLILTFLLYVLQKRKRLIQQANLLLANKHQEVEQKAKELEAVNKELHKVSQFKTDLSGMIVHDLKNPLNAIINIVQLDADNKEKIIEDAGRRMLNMVMNILDVNKYESRQLKLQRSKVNLLEVIRESYKDYEFSAQQQKITIGMQCHEHSWVEVDADLIYRVMSNLISNAISYSPVNGRIDIEVTYIEEDLLMVSVKDEGPGVSELNKDIIFEPYKGSDRNAGHYSSTGLGLAFCKLVVQAHGGLIGVDNKQAGGSSFWYTLPVTGRRDDSDTCAVLLDSDEQGTLVNVQRIETSARAICNSRKNVGTINQLFQNLEDVDVYEISRIRVILSQIMCLNEMAFGPWLQAVDNAVTACDLENFRKLMHQINIKN
ncbi:MAG: tetratricopeptide repeat-containing sensor histidine kinase [Marinilabiliaceae bacterium]|nr:tetratricopeptide repeat-containing sensor histidine kinase [Marinilabiliaceae bacterium]